MEFCHEKFIRKAIKCFDKPVSTIPITPLLSKHFLYISTSLRRVCCELYPSLNIYNRFDNFALMNGSIYEYISLSNNFDRGDRTFIGRKLFLQVKSPAFYMLVSQLTFIGC